jgi:acetolactate synthase-1/2/3 large subunit
MKASDLFVKALENEGVYYIFGVPGEENLDILESIRTSSIKLITTRHTSCRVYGCYIWPSYCGPLGCEFIPLEKRGIE